MNSINLKIVLWIENDINTKQKNEPKYPADYVAGLLTNTLINPTKQRTVFIIDQENKRTGIVLIEVNGFEIVLNRLIQEINNNKNFSNIEAVTKVI